jgi:hypothetical protein
MSTGGGLGAILGGMQVDPTRLRRGLGDALMGIGAIGLGQDPFSVMQAQKQGRREEERTQIEDQRYAKQEERQGKLDARDDEKWRITKQGIEQDQAQRAQAQKIMLAFAGTPSMFGKEVGETIQNLQAMGSLQPSMGPGAGQGIAGAMGAQPQQGGMAGILQNPNITDSERAGLVQLAQLGVDPEVFMGEVQKAVMSGPDDAKAPTTQGGLQYVDGQWQPIPGYEDMQGRIAARSRAPEKPDKPTENERQIQALVSRGFSQAEAEDIAFGVVRLTQPDDFGTVYMVNIATGESKPVGGGANAAAVGGQSPVPEAAAGPATPPIAQDVSNATGIGSNVEHIINSTIGQAVPGSVFPETADARQRVALFEKTAQEGLVNNPRFPVAEQERVRAMIPTAGAWLEDPDDAVRKVENLRVYLEQKRGAIENSLQNARITSESRGALTDQMAAIDRVLNMMGGTGGGQAQPQQQGGGQNWIFKDGKLVPE